jgi:GNAT superfamily N-acetyltransferase
MDLALRRICDIERALLVDFACGSDSLEEFLRDSAHDYAEHGITETAVAFAEPDPSPIGYFSLSADVLRLSDAEGFELGLPFECPIHSFPAVKITKLAVRTDMQGAGIGWQLVKLIEGLAFHGSVAVRLLTVDAINNPPALRFYERCGFRSSTYQALQQQPVRAGGRQRGPARANNEPPRTILMYRDLFDPMDDAAPAALRGANAPDQLLVDNPAAPANPAEQPRA